MVLAMTAEELKKDIHQLVDSVQDDITLVDLRIAIALIIEQKDMLLDEDDPTLRERMNKLTGQIERGEYITNEEMRRQI